jgi:hypothetical protein
MTTEKIAKSAEQVIKDHDALKLEVFAQYKENGGNATLAAHTVGVPERTARRWIEKMNGKRGGKKASDARLSTISGKAKILLIPDTQVKPGVDITHFKWLGQYMCDLDDKPTHVVHIGDHWDMESLSSYDKGKKKFEGRRYKRDIESGNKAMQLMFEPIDAYNETAEVKFEPEYHFHFGNHENRISRAIDIQPEFEGVIGYDEMDLSRWIQHPFLEVNVINGVAFSHYFQTGMMGRPPSSARALLNWIHMSGVQGHVQKVDIAYGKNALQELITCLFCGTFYSHDEEYLGPQGNSCYRGVWLLNEVENGNFQLMQVSLDFLKRKYGAQ